jgi:hypothetical protein
VHLTSLERALSQWNSCLAVRLPRSHWVGNWWRFELSLQSVAGQMLTGKDYPMSSSLSAEVAPMGSRAKMVLSVFSCIGLGAITSSIVYVILLTAFKGAIHQDIAHLEWVWRLLLGIGLVPCALTLYARLTMKETKPYEKCKADSHPNVSRLKRLTPL